MPFALCVLKVNHRVDKGNLTSLIFNSPQIFQRTVSRYSGPHASLDLVRLSIKNTKAPYVGVNRLHIADWRAGRRENMSGLAGRSYSYLLCTGFLLFILIIGSIVITF